MGLHLRSFCTHRTVKSVAWLPAAFVLGSSANVHGYAVLTSAYELYDATAATLSVASGDLNGDTVPDLVAGTVGGAVSVWLGSGDGTFRSMPRLTSAFASATAISLADVNQDGRLDLLTSGQADGWALVSALGNGDGTFQTPRRFHVGFGNAIPSAIMVGDVVAGAEPDAIVAQGGAVYLLPGMGNGGFSDATMGPVRQILVGSSISDAAFVDVNGDLRGDLIVTDRWYPSDGTSAVYLLLGMGSGQFQPPVRFNVNPGATALTCTDLDGDGDVDIAVSCGDSKSISLLLGNADGTFTAAPSATTGGYPLDVESGDVNGDSIIDLIAPGTGSPYVSVFLGEGRAHFRRARQIETGLGAYRLTVQDFDRDGRLDLAVAAQLAHGVAINRGNGDGTFGQVAHLETGVGPAWVAVGDWNLDGRQDILAVNGESATMSVFYNGGFGLAWQRLEWPTGERPGAGAVADLDGDSRADVVIPNSGSNTLSVFHGTPGGGFVRGTDVYTGSRPVAVGARDFDEDGFIDLAVANSNAGTVTIFRGASTGAFFRQGELHVGEAPAFVTTGDINNDGHIDLIVANRDSRSVSILPGHGDASFGQGVDYSMGRGPICVVAADLNMDGLLDIATANSDSATVSVRMNTGGGEFGPRTDRFCGGGDVNTIGNSRPSAVAAADMTGDGVPDLIVTNEATNSLCLFPGTGNGTFAPPTFLGCGRGPAGVALGDFNSDGLRDATTANRSEDGVSLLLNSVQGPVVAVTVQNIQAFADGDGVHMAWELVGVESAGLLSVNVERELQGSAGVVTLGRLAPSPTMTLDDGTVSEGGRYIYRLLLLFRNGRIAVGGEIEVGVSHAALPTALGVPYADSGRGIILPYSIAGGMSRARLEILDVRGRRLAAWQGLPSGGGQHELVWDRRDWSGTRIARGVYVVRLDSDGATITRKMVLTH